MSRIFFLHPNGSSFIHFGSAPYLETTKMQVCQSSVFLYLDSLPALSFFSLPHWNILARSLLRLQDLQDSLGHRKVREVKIFLPLFLLPLVFLQRLSSLCACRYCWEVSTSQVLSPGRQALPLPGLAGLR